MVKPPFNVVLYKTRARSRIKLNILGEEISAEFNIRDKYARMADIVPLARKLSTSISKAVLHRLYLGGETVPCCKGCSACCNYLVPLSVPEAFRLKEEILLIRGSGGGGNQIFEKCVTNSGSILAGIKNGFPVGGLESNYGSLGISCPFLIDGICAFYSKRPTACREYIVTGSAGFCDGGVEGPKVADMPVSVLECLGELASELEGSDLEAVILPFMFAWADDNKERDEQRWPAEMMVEKFVEILEAKACECLVESVCLSV